MRTPGCLCGRLARDREPELGQLLGRSGAGAPVSGSAPPPSFGKATTSRRLSVSPSCIAMRSMPGAMPPCGGAPKRSARSRKPKRSSASAGIDADHVEHARLQLGAVDADRPRGHLEAVQHHVVGLREHGAGIALEQLLVLALGRRERMVLGRPAAAVLVAA